MLCSERTLLLIDDKGVEVVPEIYEIECWFTSDDRC